MSPRDDERRTAGQSEVPGLRQFSNDVRDPFLQGAQYSRSASFVAAEPLQPGSADVRGEDELVEDAC